MNKNGDIVVISSKGSDNVNGIDAGKVEVFQFNGNSWSQLGNDILGQSAGDNFGARVSINDAGTRIAVSSPLASPNSKYEAGKVDIYEWNGNNWMQLGSSIEGIAANSRLSQVELNSQGNVIGISTRMYSSQDGYASVYEWNGSNWIQKGPTIFKGNGHGFGNSIAISDNGNTIVIGAISFSAGYLSVYDWNGSSWNQRGFDIQGAGSGSQFGRSVSISSDGNTILGGATYYNSAAGCIQSFEWSGTSWVSKGSLISGNSSNDKYGWSCDISQGGDTIVGGAYNASNGGYVKAYYWNGANWTLLGNQISAQSSGDRFGISVNLSTNSNRLVAGAYYNDNNGFNAGQARVFEISCNSYSSITVNQCAAYTVPSGDTTYTSTGIYTDTVLNSFGCDSIITIDLTINNTYSNLTVQTCNPPYTVPSGTASYSSSGTYYDTIPSTNGCAIILIIDLTVGSPTSSTFNVSACGSYTVPSGDETYTSSGTYMDTILNASGCDSVMTINVSINQDAFQIINETACSSYTVPSGDESYTSSGSYLDTIPTVAGCDSVLAINLNILNSFSQITIDTCNTYTVPSGDETYTSSGTYLDTIPNSAGCDSIITINLTISSPSNTISVSSCSSYTVPSGGQTYTASGTYTDILQAANGCDSILTINLTINNSSSATLNETACSSYTVPSGDETYITSGTY
ncbi:FG-GAP repeat protein, partial [Salibacter halophilus]